MKRDKSVLSAQIARLAISAVVLTLGAHGALAADLAIGSAMPSFSLPGVEGKAVSSQEFAGKKAVAVVFADNKCTYFQAYQSRLIRLQQEYAGQGVQFVLINPNILQKDSAVRVEQMKACAEEFKYPFPFLIDATQGTAKAFGASRTPEVFVFGADRKLVYRGQIDDNTEEKMVHKSDVKLALDALLKGTPNVIEKPVTNAFGCSIKWNP